MAESHHPIPLPDLKNEMRCIVERLAVTETQIVEMKEQTTERVRIAISTAEKALTKVEAAADRVNVDNQISALKEAIVTQIEYQREAIQSALVAADRAVTKAELSAEKRFESVNEFRGQLADQQRQFVVKTEVDFRFKAVEDKIEFVLGSLSESKGRSGGLQSAWLYLIGAGTLAGAIAGIIINTLMKH